MRKLEKNKSPCFDLTAVLSENDAVAELVKLSSENVTRYDDRLEARKTRFRTSATCT